MVVEGECDVAFAALALVRHRRQLIAQRTQVECHALQLRVHCRVDRIGAPHSCSVHLRHQLVTLPRCGYAIRSLGECAFDRSQVTAQRLSRLGPGVEHRSQDAHLPTAQHVDSTLLFTGEDDIGARHGITALAVRARGGERLG